LTPEALFDHWQGHRRLTRRVIEAFPSDKLFTFSVGGMRPFGEMLLELLAMTAPMARGLLTGEWGKYAPGEAASKEELLARWDADTATLDEILPKVNPARYVEQMVAFGEYPGTGSSLVMYVVDNEIHHRAQSYVYLRALGITPPPFYER
jgi:uncharacterized damage-inducible protein DinB